MIINVYQEFICCYLEYLIIFGGLPHPCISGFGHIPHIFLAFRSDQFKPLQSNRVNRLHNVCFMIPRSQCFSIWLFWLVSGFKLSENYLSNGMIIPHTWKPKKCSKPPTSWVWAKIRPCHPVLSQSKPLVSTVSTPYVPCMVYLPTVLEVNMGKYTTIYHTWCIWEHNPNQKRGCLHQESPSRPEPTLADLVQESVCCYHLAKRNQRHRKNCDNYQSCYIAVVYVFFYVLDLSWSIQPNPTYCMVGKYSS